MVIKQPSELTCKNHISMLVYGQPGIGKTTLGCSAPQPVLFDFDEGVQRMNVAHQVPTVQVQSWNDVLEALNEIKQGAFPCKSIVIDTAGKMLDFMSKDIIEHNPRYAQSDGALTLKGYGARKQMFVQFVKDVLSSGLNVVFVAHEKEDKQGDVIIRRPDMSGSSLGDLMKEIDLVGYMYADINNRRVISFEPNSSFYAKNACSVAGTVEVPVVVKDGEAVGNNAFVNDIIKSYVKLQETGADKRKEYDKLIDDYASEVSAIKDAKSANAVLGKFSKEQHIFNSRLRIGRMLNTKCTELGLKYDDKTKKYA